MSQQRITFSFILDNPCDMDEIISMVRKMLRKTSDYQHDNIWLYKDNNEKDICIMAFPEDLRDLARSREALNEVFSYILDQIT